MAKKIKCEIMMFCPREESTLGERERGGRADDKCIDCGKYFCLENEHGDMASGLCRDCQENQDDEG